MWPPMMKAIFDMLNPFLRLSIYSFNFESASAGLDPSTCRLVFLAC
jgi:hypothetical protein